MTPVANALVIIADRIARTHPDEAEALLHMAASCRAHNDLVLRLIDENKRLEEVLMCKAQDASDVASQALQRIVREHARDTGR